MSEAGPLIRFFKSNKCIVIHKCTTIRHAKVCPAVRHIPVWTYSRSAG